jgi:hypothetical protein
VTSSQTGPSPGEGDPYPAEKPENIHIFHCPARKLKPETRFSIRGKAAPLFALVLDQFFSDHLWNVTRLPFIDALLSSPGLYSERGPALILIFNFRSGRRSLKISGFWRVNLLASIARSVLVRIFPGCHKSSHNRRLRYRF